MMIVIPQEYHTLFNPLKLGRYCVPPGLTWRNSSLLTDCMYVRVSYESQREQRLVPFVALRG